VTEIHFGNMESETEHTIFGLVRLERLARDTNDWAALQSVYWPGSRVRVTWFDGPIEDFVERSKASVRPGHVGGFHTVDPVRAGRHGDRVVVESRGQILLRPFVEGIECDLTSWCRFVSGFELRDAEWRMAFFDNIYVKDQIVPTRPGQEPALDQSLLSGSRASYQWLSYTNERRGITVPRDLPGDDRPDLVAAFWTSKQEWLHST
jgi:hypothetical protein